MTNKVQLNNNDQVKENKVTDMNDSDQLSDDKVQLNNNDREKENKATDMNDSDVSAQLSDDKVQLGNINKNNDNDSNDHQQNANEINKNINNDTNKGIDMNDHDVQAHDINKGQLENKKEDNVNNGNDCEGTHTTDDCDSLPELNYEALHSSLSYLKIQNTIVIHFPGINITLIEKCFQILLILGMSFTAYMATTLDLSHIITNLYHICYKHTYQ